MTSTYVRSSLLTLYAGLAFASPASNLGPEILKLVPPKVDLSNTKWTSARKELEEIVGLCGPGVIEGAVSATGVPLKNTCSYQVALNDWFFKPLKEKTGLIHDREWPYLDGVTWYQAPSMAELPDSFDLRELMKNGQPDIRKQNCGDCWAWATHHGLEIARAVHDEKVVDLAIQTVLSCSRKGSCSGGYMSAVDFLIHGLPEEGLFPYAGSDKSCKFSSSDIQTGWEGKIIASPYIGDSRRYSRALQSRDGSFAQGAKVGEMMAAMVQWRSPLVVTVEAYSISGPGIYDSCSAINSGGNHMVTVVGWDTNESKRIAHVWNSWGKSHGENGVSRIQWECGDGKLNRGLGYSAKIVQYKTPCTPPNAAQVYLHETQAGKAVTIGVPQSSDTNCTWVPTTGLSNPNSCVTSANPKQTTEYHLTAKNNCGTSSSMTLVQVWPARLADKIEGILTPYGVVAEK